MYFTDSSNADPSYIKSKNVVYLYLNKLFFIIFQCVFNALVDDLVEGYAGFHIYLVDLIESLGFYSKAKPHKKDLSRIAENVI